MGRDIDVWSGQTPEDLIEKMFERTDADGVLYMRSFLSRHLYSIEDESLRCVMSWEQPGDCFATLQEFDQLRSVLEQIAERSDNEGFINDAVYQSLTEKQKKVFDAYLCGFKSVEEFDFDRIYDIQGRLDTIEDVRRICKKIGSGIEADQWEADYLKDFVGESVTDEDRAYFRQWFTLKNEEAKQRLGDSPFAYYIIQHAWRYYKVITLKAPDIIVMNEARGLAAALSLFRWCKKYEYVDNAVRSHYDRLELMSDEELDALHRPRKNANSRKSMVSLFVYLILKQHSDSEHPLKQQEILSYLAEEPYEIVVERKALSRVIQNLKSSQLGIYTDKHRGSWFMGGDN